MNLIAVNSIAGLIWITNSVIVFFNVLLYIRIKIEVQLLTASLYKQIEKLVFANHIDQAIELCSKAQDAFAAKMMKRLLLLVNRPHELELCYQEILLMNRQRDNQKFLLVEFANYLILFLSWIFMFVALKTNEHDWFTVECVIGIILANLVTIFALFRIRQYLSETMTYILCLKNLLLNKTGYVPPQYRPVPMSEEELRQWRERMDQFNKTIASARTAGDTRPAHELYDEKSDADEVLQEL